jgi:rare lipoprotein A
MRCGNVANGGAKMYRLLFALGVAVPLATTALAQQPKTQEGQASYFNGGQNGHSTTASGKPVQPDQNTAASPNLPLGSHAKVTNERTGKSTDVEVTDRGPTRSDRQIDVSKKAAGDIGMKKSGTAPVKIEPENK